MNCLVMWFEAHPGTASWAQAIGSILALIIALSVPFQQNRMMRRDALIRAHEQAIQLFDALGAMANFAGQRLLSIQNDMHNEDFFDTLTWANNPEESLRQIAIEFDRYPLHQLPDHDSVSTALELKASFASAWSYVREAALSEGRIPEYAEAVDQLHFEFDHYSVLVERFSEQAKAYRLRIARS